MLLCGLSPVSPPAVAEDLPQHSLRSESANDVGQEQKKGGWLEGPSEPARTAPYRGGRFPTNLNEDVELMLVRVVRQDCRHGNSKEATLKRTLLSFLSDESGATAIEYGLIAAGIALAIIAVVNGLGTNLNTQYTSINNSLK
jgi:pilus assembly protein Flp/PilA